jgi:hypothetical protein
LGVLGNGAGERQAWQSVVRSNSFVATLFNSSAFAFLT